MDNNFTFVVYGPDSILVDALIQQIEKHLSDKIENYARGATFSISRDKTQKAGYYVCIIKYLTPVEEIQIIEQPTILLIEDEGKEISCDPECDWTTEIAGLHFIDKVQEIFFCTTGTGAGCDSPMTWLQHEKNLY